MNFIGELAGLATSFFFAMTALIFTSTGRSVGSQVTHRVRLTFALLYLVIINLVLFREPLPFSAESSRWWDPSWAYPLPCGLYSTPKWESPAPLWHGQKAIYFSVAIHG